MRHPLTLVPAIDLRNGRCVRLAQGDPSRETSYTADPVSQARLFVDAGAQRLHVVDLDGAFGSGENVAALRAICAAVDVPVQTGGGIRSEHHLNERFAAGAAAVILGTLLIEQPDEARRLVDRYGDRIIAGVDVRGSSVAIRGWETKSPLDRDSWITTFSTWGITRIVFTEISRDGMGTGYDLAALREVAALVPTVRFTASGGAATLAHLAELAEQTPPHVDQAIIGRALYEGQIDLEEALRLATP